MNELFSMQGRNALITGGTRGLGRAITLRFARAGANVIANYVRDQKAADDLMAEAGKAGLQVETCRADLTSAKGMNTLLECVASKFDRLSVMVHCAATGVHRPLTELTLRHFDWTYALNVRAFFELVRRLLPRFQAGASILAISSEGASRAATQYCLVGSSKGALESLVRHFAMELAPGGIRVNTLASGTIQTDAWQVLPDGEARLAAARERSPVRRLNTVEEVAWAAQFLCSDAASGVVGQTLVVDGGLSIVS